MFTSLLRTLHSRSALILLGMALLSLLVSACVAPGGPTASGTPAPAASGTTTTGGSPTFPSGPPPLRTPTFGTAGQEAPTVKVLPSVAPTVIIQFPLVPVSIKTLF